MLRRGGYRNKYHAHVVEIIYRRGPRVHELTLIPHETKKSRFNFVDHGHCVPHPLVPFRRTYTVDRVRYLCARLGLRRRIAKFIKISKFC